MNALKNRNENGELLTLKQVCELSNLGSSTVRRIAEKSNSVRKIGKCYRINRKTFLDYVEHEYSL